ncbi:hypothetical protein [Roseibium album]|uniref:hypothetical protein n=1 Tax=Roseibium album TaxID=311410 RepID=UPI003BB1613D
MKQDFIVDRLRKARRVVPDFLLSEKLVDDLNSVEFEIPNEMHFDLYLLRFQQRNKAQELFPVAKSMVDDDVIAILYEPETISILQLHDFSSGALERSHTFDEFEDWLKFRQEES